MNEKEKKAIELLKHFKIELNNIESYERPDVEEKYKKILIVLQENDFDTFQTILSLIEKQRKEIEELKEKNTQLTNYLNDSYYVSEDKLKEKIDKYRKKIEKLHSQELWNEPEDSIKDFKYNHYLEAFKELLGE